MFKSPADFTPDFSKAHGLIAAIAQDAATGEVLMLAWMNEEAWKATLATGEAHYWSRSRQSLWHKGESSGMVQKVKAIRLDCDADAVVIIDDSGIYNQSATLMDVKPEGCGKAYARKVSNMVRYLTLTVRIQRGATSPYTDAVMVADLYRMAQSPYQVLAYNGSCMIKGYIETIAYDPASVGTAYHVMKVTVAEGER